MKTLCKYFQKPSETQGNLTQRFKEDMHALKISPFCYIFSYINWWHWDLSSNYKLKPYPWHQTRILQNFICDSLLEDKKMIFGDLNRPQCSCFFMQFSWKRQEKSGHSTTGCRWWTNEGLQIYWASFTEPVTVPSTVADYLIGPLNKVDVMTSILQMRKLWLERLSNKLKSTHLVCGTAGIRTQFSPAFPESSLSTCHFSFPSHLFPQKIWWLFFLSPVWVQHHHYGGYIWVTGLM